MKTISAGEFKQTCLRLLDEVEETGQPLVITKRGRPVAQILPYRTSERHDWGETLRGSVRFVGDIVTPPASIDEWEGLVD